VASEALVQLLAAGTISSRLTKALVCFGFSIIGA